jgi:hypothetical protein
VIARKEEIIQTRIRRGEIVHFGPGSVVLSLDSRVGYSPADWLAILRSLRIVWQRAR